MNLARSQLKFILCSCRAGSSDRWFCKFLGLRQEVSKENKPQGGPEELICIQRKEFMLKKIIEHLSFAGLDFMHHKFITEFTCSIRASSYSVSLWITSFLQIFAIVHILDCSHWLLSHVNTKASHVVVYDSIQLKNDKYQWYLNALVRNQPIRQIYLILNSLFNLTNWLMAIPLWWNHFNLCTFFAFYLQRARVRKGSRSSKSRIGRRCRDWGRQTTVKSSWSS